MPFWVSARACAVGSQRAQCSSSKTQATRKSELLSGCGRKRGQFSSCAPLMSWQLSQLAALSQWVVVKSESWLDLEILFEKKTTPDLIPIDLGGGFAGHPTETSRHTALLVSTFFLSRDAVLSQR